VARPRADRRGLCRTGGPDRRGTPFRCAAGPRPRSASTARTARRPSRCPCSNLTPDTAAAAGAQREHNEGDVPDPAVYAAFRGSLAVTVRRLVRQLRLQYGPATPPL